MRSITPSIGANYDHDQIDQINAAAEVTISFDENIFSYLNFSFSTRRDCHEACAGNATTAVGFIRSLLLALTCVALREAEHKQALV
jgi:hypothetical protein